MNRDDDAGPCPRCGGPSKCVDYDEAPWGARGNYTYGCEKCGEFYEVPQEVTAEPTPLEYRFRNDTCTAGPGPAGVQFSDKAIPGAVDVVIRVIEGFQPGELHLREFTSIKTRLPAGAKVLSEMPSSPDEPKRCQRCGRLTETCDSGLYGDCVDYRRR